MTRTESTIILTFECRGRSEEEIIFYVNLKYILLYFII